MFEIAKTSTGYASAPATLVSFNGADGAGPYYAGLIADANGDLFGTTFGGGVTNWGTVFEIAKTATGYASAPTTLVSFNGTDGANPDASLIENASGDLFGTTLNEGTSGKGTVFEIAKTATGYASAPTTLVSFNGADGANSFGGLVADANGDLFRTTSSGGANGDGTVFEIKNAGTALNPSNLTAYGGLLLFNGTDAAGTVGLWAYNGASGYELSPIAGSASTGVNPYSMLSLAAVTGSILSQNTDGQAAIWELSGTNIVEARASAAIPDRPGKQSERATSTMTAIPTSCGGTRVGRSRSGR